MNCQDGFEAEGEIRLLGAHITGQLGLNGAHVTNSGGYTLAADWLTAAGVFCPDFVAEGEMWLLGAHIAGQLSLIGAHLINPGAVALTADILTVDGNMFCRGFEAEGEMRLLGANIAGQLVLDGAHLTNPGKRALNADALTVGNGMFCQNGFRVEGHIGIPSAHITGQLGFRGGTLHNGDREALNCQELHADSLWLDSLTVTGTVALQSAEVTVLVDDPGRWPAHLLLNGLTYRICIHTFLLTEIQAGWPGSPGIKSGTVRSLTSNWQVFTGGLGMTKKPARSCSPSNAVAGLASATPERSSVWSSTGS